MDDIKDVKPPVNVPVEFADYQWWIYALAAALIVAIVVFLYLRLRKRPVTPSVPAVTVPPWETAFRQLLELKHKNYPERGLFKVFYIELSGIARHYLEDQLAIKAPEMTTEEFLNFAKISAVLTQGHKDILRDFLNGCDMVKFAQHEPSVNDAKAHFDLVKKLIEETKG